MIHCDTQLCVGCKMCEVTCSVFHFGAVSPSLSRIRVAKLEETGVDLAVACVSCAEKPCLICPTSGLALGDRGEIRFMEDLCTFCEVCAEACPIGAVGFHDNLPLFCDLCGGEPACVDTCPTRALSYTDEVGESLEAFKEDGRPSVKRARYARARAVPLRGQWLAGQRVDS